jgi:BirA family biotin operon repressor/biotin-[acetyl-CoA-carboxylase] ligase
MNKTNSKKIIATKVYHFKEIDSTNDYASFLLSNNKPDEGTVITADSQTKGRGQYGRKWLSDSAENLLMSVILYPLIKADEQFELNIMVSLAVKEAIEKAIGEEIKVKWPNDLYHNREKIAGILIQNFISGQNITTSIIGIGVNVNQIKFASEAENATSLAKITQSKINLQDFKSILYSCLDKYYNLLKNNNIPRGLYVNNLMRLHQPSLYVVGEREISGIIKGIDKMGQLVVSIDNKEQAFQMGEIRMKI